MKLDLDENTVVSNLKATDCFSDRVSGKYQFVIRKLLFVSSLEYRNRKLLSNMVW